MVKEYAVQEVGGKRQYLDPNTGKWSDTPTLLTKKEAEHASGWCSERMTEVVKIK